MVASPEGVLDHVVPIELGESHMMHDFAITDRHAIFWVLPVVFSLDALSTGMPFKWDPSLPSKVGVLPLDGTADQMKWFEVDQCMVFHSANAFEANGKIEVDVCWLSAAFDGKDLSQTSKNELRRWTIDMDSTKVTEKVRSTTLQDFPQIDRRYTGRENQHTWLTRIADVGDIGIEFAGITHRDESTQEEVFWDGKGRYGPGEPFFVPESKDAGEGEGFVLTYAFDRTRDNSDLLIFEALDIAKGPIAQVHLPRRVPYGFHGVFVPA
jgi:carotenoid cleavage dioxygenase